MKIASLILPFLDNDGKDLFLAHQQLKHDLLTRWHGYTSYEVIGGWSGANGMVEGEKAVRYDVAIPHDDIVTFRDMAAAIARDCRQECVMIITPMGEVEFVKPRMSALEKVT